MSLRFFADRMPALVWRTPIVSSWLRPVGFCGERASSRSSSALTHCLVGTAGLFGDAGPTRGAVPAGPRSPRHEALERRLGTLGVSARRMLEALIAGTHDPQVLAELACGRLRRKLPALREALSG